MMAQPKLEAILKQHEALLRQSVEMSDVDTIIPKVIALLETLAQAGAGIDHPEYRSQLRALIRYWASFVNDKTGKFPTFQLKPFDVSQSDSELKIPKVKGYEHGKEDILPSLASSVSEKVDEQVLTPALIVMLGSTPVNAGIELCRLMLTLSQNDRHRVVLVYIDTDQEPSNLVSFRKEYPGVFREFRLRIAVPVGIDYLPLPQHSSHTYIPSVKPQYFASGAGGLRNNAHVAAAFDHRRIAHTLETALRDIEQIAIMRGERSVREVQVNIVAFLGGGTGSGILGDIAVIIRQLLLERQYQHRINLFCELPTWILGSDEKDISWRQSNATACLLELLALSLAAGNQSGHTYKKYMLNESYDVTRGPIANEVYLIGKTLMDAADTARIIGLDLFQRITDASGIGALEHSTWMNRFQLSGTDERGLPTMFSTSCPFEVRFSAEETATAFAQISTAQLLAMFTSYQPSSINVSDLEKRDWVREWRNVVRFDTSIDDPTSIKIAEFRRSEFEKVDQSQLDSLWRRLVKFEGATVMQIQEMINSKRREEMTHIDEIPKQSLFGVSVLDEWIQHLKRLQQEYISALDDLKERGSPKVPPRRSDLEANLTSKGLFARIRSQKQTDTVCDFYNERLHLQAMSTRHQLLEQLLNELNQCAQDMLDSLMLWVQSTELGGHAQDLKEMGMTSMAWQGRLDYPHPHQRHIFDLRTLRNQDNSSLAIERLYIWATGGDEAIKEGAPFDSLDYSDFVRYLFKDLVVSSFTSSSSAQQSVSRFEQNPRELVNQITNLFRKYYMIKFQHMNLLDLLDIAAPSIQREQSHGKQISSYLLEHLQHTRGLIRGLVTLPEILWHDGSSDLNTSFYIGMHWHDENQKAILDETLEKLGRVTGHSQTPYVNSTTDPHQLQVSYGQHGISLSSFPEFYRENNSLMSDYIRHQREWYGNQQPAIFPDPSPNPYGSSRSPVHSCGEMERLVCGPDELGYQEKQPHAVKYSTNLIGRVIHELEEMSNEPSEGRPNSSPTRG